ncbi:MAG: hypothetical protein E7612_03795 [Ruminococcaceae bacterium]|nr:hypothetical protein [Oscillospiraceae bacterium]
MQIDIDLSEKLGKIKRMNATGQAPMGGGIGYGAYKHFHLLSDISVPYVRLHDVGGQFAANRFVDIPNVFRDFDADENDPKNYDFTFTDLYIGELVKNGLKPYYRLGVTIENHAEVKSYRIDPPKDYEKWARICEHVIAHYNEGWADGFHYDIEYWEIWNENDDGQRASQMWNGTAEDYYRLYDVTAKHLKKRFPNIKIGGYAAIGFYYVTDTPEERELEPRHKYFCDFFHGFMEYIKSHGSPIDFFSWHSYREPKRLIEEAKWVREQLIKYGYGDIESHLNEWNPPCRLTRDVSSQHGAEIAAIMLGCQNVGVDMLMIYDARIDGSTYSAFFIPSVRGGLLSQGYYVFAAFSSLYNLGDQVKLDCDTEGVYAICATNGKKNSLMISNISGEDQELKIEGVDLTDARWYLIDNRRLLSWSPEIKTMKNNTVILVEF